MKTALTIAGTDPSGGAGIQADIKTMTANGVFATCAVTALVAQNTTGVKSIVECTPDFLAEELDCVFTDIFPDAVKTGMVSSIPLIRVIAAKLKEYGAKNLVVDPVMGDHGRPYRTITPQMRSRLGELVRVADIITPNLTEACMLLKIPYFNEGLSRAQAKSLLVRLSELGPNYVVITGTPMASGSIANIGYDRQNNSFWYIDCDYVPVSYPGTGDLFASVLTGGFLTGDSLPMAMGRAAYFVERCIKTTFSYSSDTRYGVMLEKELGVLIDRQNIKDFSLL